MPTVEELAEALGEPPPGSTPADTGAEAAGAAVDDQAEPAPGA